MPDHASNEHVPIPVRLTAGILQGLVVGAGALGVTAVVNGIRKIVSKTPGEIALFPKRALYIIGAGSAVVGAFHALTVKAYRTSQDNLVLTNELWKADGPAANQEVIVDKMLTQAQGSALTIIEHHPETTKHRDAVDSSRVESAESQVS